MPCHAQPYQRLAVSTAKLGAGGYLALYLGTLNVAERGSSAHPIPCYQARVFLDDVLYQGAWRADYRAATHDLLDYTRETGYPELAFVWESRWPERLPEASS